MKLLRLKAKNYRSLRDVSIDLEDFNVFIGANASGKSTILDALRFLHEGVHARDFDGAVSSRGGILNLAWKGEKAHQIDLAVTLLDDGEDRKDGDRIEWSARITKHGFQFHVAERVERFPPQSPPSVLLEADRGAGWWWSRNTKEQPDADQRQVLPGQVEMKQPPTACALAAASSDATFPARDVASFVRRWGFFDPNPFLLRRDWPGLEASRLDHYGRNLAETLYTLKSASPDVFDLIRSATQDIVGLPTSIEPRVSEDRRYYFVQTEGVLRFTVHQMGVSSGTLRMLALMTALHGEPGANLLGIEEPENYVHPSALSAFVDYVRDARERVQFMVTTHSPLLLDLLNEPEAVCVVQRQGGQGAAVSRQSNAAGIRKALAESGFSLGEYYQTKGFGGI